MFKKMFLMLVVLPLIVAFTFVIVGCKSEKRKTLPEIQAQVQRETEFREKAGVQLARTEFLKGADYDEQGNYQEAVYWYRQAADKGSAAAQYTLGFMYHDGRGLKQSYPEAVKWFIKAAEQEYPPAQTALGIMYLHGVGVAQDTDEAVKLLSKAAEQGYEHAQEVLNGIPPQDTSVSYDTYTPSKSTYQKTAHSCGGCGGTGRVNNYIEFNPSYDGENANYYCDECHKYTGIYLHRHSECKNCNGTGTLSY